MAARECFWCETFSCGSDNYCIVGIRFFTGLSPSVVRSVIMFSLLALSVLSRRTGISLNTLALTACIMLVVHPFGCSM